MRPARSLGGTSIWVPSWTSLNDVTTVGTAVAGKFRGKVLFSRADGVKYNGHLKNVGLSGKSPFGFGVEDQDGKHWVFPEDQEFTEAALTKFVEGMVAGELQPTLKSEPVPTKQEGPVKVLVGQTFEKEIKESPNDIFVEFYAPWCGHCKSLAPIYDQLAERLAPVKTITIAKIDATANDTPGFRVQGFPTLKLIKAADKANPVPYEGERTLEAMMAFLQANASHKFDAPEPKDEL
eukprot:tig00021038_g17574.t1